MKFLLNLTSDLEVSRPPKFLSSSCLMVEPNMSGGLLVVWDERGSLTKSKRDFTDSFCYKVVGDLPKELLMVGIGRLI